MKSRIAKLRRNDVKMDEYRAALAAFFYYINIIIFVVYHVIMEQKSSLWMIADEYRKRIDERSAEMIINESESCLNEHQGISEKITDRSYALMRALLAVYPIAGGVVLAIDVRYKFIIFIYMLVLLCVVFICLYQATRPYKSQTTHDSPRNVVYESDILSDNVYKSLLFSKIEAAQQKIDIVLHSNKIRLRHYKSAMNVIYAGVILFFAAVSVMLAIT